MAHDRARRDHLDHQLLMRYARSRDPALLDRLARRFAPLARSIARAYADRGEPLDDVLQAADLGLVLALQRFEPAAGVRFSTFAVPTIRGEVRRHFRDRCWPVHVPRATKELEARVRAAAAEAERRTGRRPSTADLAAALGEGHDAVADARRAGAAFRSRPLPEGDEAQPAGFARDDPGFAGVERRDALDRGFAALGARDRLIVQRRLEGRRQHEIGRELGVSQVQVSRLLRRAHARMRAGVEGGATAEALAPGA